MILRLVARHIRDDQDYELEESEYVDLLLERMRHEIEANKAEGSNWRYSIQPHEDEYK